MIREPNSKFEYIKILKVLHIGACFEEKLDLHQLQIERLEIEIVDQSLLNINVTKQKVDQIKEPIFRFGQMEYTSS